MRVDDFDYDLPEAQIAQTPADARDAARLLVLDRSAATLADRHVRDLPALLVEGDLLVLNDTRVLPARLFATRDTGGRVEVFLLEPQADGSWTALLRSGGSPQPGEVLAVGAHGIRLEARDDGALWRVTPVGGPFEALMAADGRMPLPPYIRRETEDPRDALDRERYQTVFAETTGAVAAPTAGLHFTPRLFQALDARGVETARVTLHVGVGTFAPVRAERLEDHAMHAERYVIPDATAAAVRGAKADGRRVVAVGTTTVRALEGSSARSDDGLPTAESASTDLFITPGFDFRVVDALLTNFHLPRSTLLALVSAFAGRERVLSAYRHAVDAGYRFYSYGDAMLIV